MPIGQGAHRPHESRNPPALVGRQVPLEALLDTWAQTSDRCEGRLVVITGEAGIGKTSLARALADALDGAAQHLWGVCGPTQDAPELWPWINAVKPWQDIPAVAAFLAGAMGDPAGSRTRHVDRTLQFGQLVAVLVDQASLRPVLLVLDDLHRADNASLRLLRFLLPHLAVVPLLVVATARSGDIQAPDLYRAALERSSELPLAGLSRAETARMLGQSRTHRALRQHAVEVHARTGGNPFLTDQFIRLVDAGRSVDAGLSAVGERRFGLFPEGCRRLLGVVAVAGEDASLVLLANLQGGSARSVEHDLDPAVVAGVVNVGTDQRVRFSHDLHREHALEELGEQQVAATHRRVAAALQSLATSSSEVPVRRLLHHLLASGVQPGAERAQLLEWLDAAVHECLGRGAYDEAAVLLSDAAGLARAGDDRGRQRRLELRLAESLLHAGSTSRAREMSVAVRFAAAQAGDGDVLAAASLVELDCGANTWDSQGSITGLLEEAARARGARPDALQARLLAGLARSLAQTGGDQLERARPLSHEAVALAERLDDPGLLAACIQSCIGVVWAPGTARERLALARQMQDAAAAGGNPVLVMEAQLAALSALLELADPAVHRELDELEHHARRTPHPHLRWLVLTRRTTLMIASGDLERAGALMDEERQLGHRLEEPDTENIAGAHWVSCEIWRRGLADTWLYICSLPEGGPQHPAAPVLGDCLRYASQGDDAAAGTVLRSRLEPLIDQTPTWRGIWGHCMEAEVSAMIGAHDVSERLYTKLEPLADTVAVAGGAADCRGPVALYLGLLAESLGRRQDALRHFRAAHVQADQLGARLWAARAGCELAGLLSAGSAQDRREASGLLDSAESAARLSGSDFLAALVAERRSHTPTPHSLTRGPDGWTITFDGVAVHLPDTKGMHDLAQLLRSPHAEIPAADLVAGAAVAAEARLGADRVLDTQARTAYRKRLQDLDGEEDRADAAGDVASSRRVQQEREQLLEALRVTAGLAGRPRLLGDGAERARKAVTARLRETLDRIATRHRPLGAHLRESVRTGQTCSYRPEVESTWVIELGQGQRRA